jgi:hypothetical protein
VQRALRLALVVMTAFVFSPTSGSISWQHGHASLPIRGGPPLPVEGAGKADPCGPDSGGRAVAHAGGKPVSRAGAPEACLYRTGFHAAEPTLGINKKGHVFYQTLDAEEWPLFPVQVIRSTDEGRTWKDVSPSLGGERRHFYTEDPYIYVDEDTGRIFTVDYLLPCSELSFSDDGGGSWTTVIMGCEIVDHQTIFSGPAPSGGTEPLTYENIVYYCSADVGLASESGQATCLKSLDGGLTFVRTGAPPFPAVGNDGPPIVECDGLHGHGVVDHRGFVYLPKGVCGQPWLAISKDEGLTWERVQVANNGTPTHEASVDVDRAGNIYYTWIGKDRLPYLAISRNGGKKWTKPIMIAAPGVKEASLPSVDVGDTGKVALIYMGSTNSPGRPWNAGEYAKVTWNGYMTISSDALAQSPVFYSAPVNNPKDPLIGGECGPFRCQAAFDFLDVVIAPDGTPWATFVDGCFKGACDHSGSFLRLGEAIAGRLVGGPRLR